MVLDDHDDDDGISNGCNQEQRDVQTNQQYTSDLGESNLPRRKLGDQPFDDSCVFQSVEFGPRNAVIVRCRYVVEHLKLQVLKMWFRSHCSSVING